VQAAHINPRLFPEQVQFIINDAADRLLFVDPVLLPLIGALEGKLPSVERTIALTSEAALPPAARGRVTSYETFISPYPATFDWPELDERTASGLCYTSGTTGHPKGVLYSHRSTVLHAYAGCMPDVLGLSGNDCVLSVVPMRC
jgi:fatty-acyl-CoA synthase